MVRLDIYIVSIALPVVAREFHATPGAVSWVTMGYLLLGSGTMLLLGRAAAVAGPRRMFLTGYAVFTLGRAALRPRAEPAAAGGGALPAGAGRRRHGRDDVQRLPAPAAAVAAGRRARPAGHRRRARGGGGLAARRAADGEPLRGARCSSSTCRWVSWRCSSPGARCRRGRRRPAPQPAAASARALPRGQPAPARLRRRRPELPRRHRVHPVARPGADPRLDEPPSDRAARRRPRRPACCSSSAKGERRTRSSPRRCCATAASSSPRARACWGSC